ncbi:MAG: hypothetical protein KDK56_04135 [Simkania sp.]|nr:hypothetical protein [Simkania sp.]
MESFIQSIACYFRDVPAQLTTANGKSCYYIGRYEFIIGSSFALCFAIYEAVKTVFNALRHPLTIQDTITHGVYKTLVYCAAVPVGLFGAFFPEMTKDFLDFKTWSKA